MPHVMYLVAAFLALPGQVPDKGDALKTVAERSEYRATARYDEVAAWCQAFAKSTPLAHLTELGHSSEGRSIPLVIVADPPVTIGRAGGAFGQADRVCDRQHSCGRGLRQRGAADAFAGDLLEPASGASQRRDPGRRADLQHGRERACLEDQSAGPGRARKREWASGPMPAVWT